MRPGTLSRLHDAHQGLTSTLQRARRIVYWPKLQQDITEMIEGCDECQRHGKKKPRPSERQITTTRPMETLGMDLVTFQGQHALVTVDYFSGFITFDLINSETTEAVTKVLNSIFQKFGLPEKILSDNGPCFKSNTFKRFCEQLDIGHLTSSPHYHQSNGRAERAIETIEQILKKARNDIEITKALTTYLDTPVSDTLPSPAELFHNRRINTRLSMTMIPVPLSDQQKINLNDKRSAHLKPSKHDRNIYLPNQPVWFTDDASEDWKPGYIESKDSAPDSYWIINNKTSRRIRRNKHDIKPRQTSFTKQRPQALESENPMRYPASVAKEHPASTDQVQRPAISEVPDPVGHMTGTSHSAANSPRQGPPTSKMPESKQTKAEPTPALMTSRSGRHIKPPRNSDFVYD